MPVTGSNDAENQGTVVCSVISNNVVHEPSHEASDIGSQCVTLPGLEISGGLDARGSI